jgi:hypothetical protein
MPGSSYQSDSIEEEEEEEEEKSLFFVMVFSVAFCNFLFYRYKYYNHRR